MPWRLAITRGPRDPARFPEDDDALGPALYARLLEAVGQGRERPAMLVLWPDRVASFGLGQALQASPGERECLLSAIAAQPDTTCAALAGVIQVRGPGLVRPVPAAVCFLEWPDNRWWAAWRIVDARGRPTGPEIERSALEGWPRPGGIGGWYARARRLGLRLRLEPVDVH